MPSVTYMNQSAPFWDFVASLEQQGSRHPSSPQGRNHNHEHEHEYEEEHHGPPPSFGPWGWGQFFGGGRGMPHRGPPPYGPPPHHHDEETGESNETSGEKDPEKDENNDNGEGPSANSGSDNEGRPHGRGHHGRCGGRRGRCGPGGPGGRGGFGGPGGRGGCGPRHGHHHGGPGGHGGRGGHGRWGPWGRGGPFGFGGNSFDPSTLAAHFWDQFTENRGSNKKENSDNEDYTPDADIFDTENAFVVHVSLPGAKKEDVGVNWDAEKSELAIAGVIYRPGDEEFLKTLAMNERKVGAFERKIRLGTRATPAHIDAEAITAKLEDGVLRVEVPKLDTGYVEVRKVDIE
ncbi:HSP20-like chaperone [Cucurbitaria berberidis CBS 394.84]|uniref:HSP20-like chaperone n=1 Tax=Cucurbitaria berberidis CBS 394.84 TaxID=1168544 RepID=A0A9P4L6U2_9PLEO|nr:HSP20-like chaperone [Cucurbitaria berberidis CBS 394.84]KAF1844326.1 HSP20-like chaperone [Cucurbitaria berberidis CBS 394.84]